MILYTQSYYIHYIIILGIIYTKLVLESLKVNIVYTQSYYMHYMIILGIIYTKLLLESLKVNIVYTQSYYWNPLKLILYMHKVIIYII